MGKKSSFFTHLLETGGFRVDENGHALLFGEYFFLMPPRVLIQLQKILYKELGKKKGKEILTEIGAYQVKTALKRYIKRFNFQKISKDKLIDFSMKIISILGIGEPKIVELEDDKIILRILNPVIPQEYISEIGKSKEPIDFYLKGIMEEFFSDIVFKNEAEVKEVKCLAKGDKYCEFVGMPKA